MPQSGDNDDQRTPRRVPDTRAGGGKPLEGPSGERPAARDLKKEKEEAVLKQDRLVRRVKASFEELYPTYSLLDCRFQLVEKDANQVKMTLAVGQGEWADPDAPEEVEPEPPVEPGPKLPLPLTTLASLVLSSTVVVLLIVVLIRQVPPPQPSTEDQGVMKIAESIQKGTALLVQESEEQKAKVKGLDDTLKALKKTGFTLPPNFAADVAAKVPPPIGIKADDVRAIITPLVNDLKERIEKLPKVIEPLPANYWNRLSEEMTKVVVNALPKPPTPPTARDTYLVITHGSAMDANRYIASLREVVAKFATRGPDATVRIGLAVASTDRLTNFVAPADPVANLNSFGNPNLNSTEEPYMIGGKLKKLFPAGRVVQRAILLVSDQAEAPAIDKGDEMEGWNDMSRVDVVILAAKDPKDFKEKDWQRYSKWCEFVEVCHGSASIIGHPDSEPRRNDLLRETLRRLVSQAE
jgi:hypothetical protein